VHARERGPEKFACGSTVASKELRSSSARTKLALAATASLKLVSARSALSKVAQVISTLSKFAFQALRPRRSPNARSSHCWPPVCRSTSGATRKQHAQSAVGTGHRLWAATYAGLSKQVGRSGRGTWGWGWG